MNTRSLIYLFALVSTGCSAADASVEELGGDSGESVDSIASAITNGTQLAFNKNYVALYHYFPSTICDSDGDDLPPIDWSLQNEWWPRPCSGTVIKKDGSTNWVLTARHCVTVDGKINTTLNAPTNLKLTSRLAPGTIPTNENANGVDPQGGPPSYTVPAAQIVAAGTPAHKDDYGQDIAIVKVIGDLQPSQSPQPYPIYANNSSPWVNRPLTGYGYGRSVPGHCWGHNGSGAGILRTVSGFSIEATGTNWVEHTSSNLIGGDSGGPVVTNVPGQFERLVGVNSTGTTAAGGPNLLAWIQSKLGHLYLIAHDRFGLSVVGSQGLDNSPVANNYTVNTSTNTWVTYDSTTKQIKINGRCAQDMGADVLVRLQPCSSALNAQKWTVAHEGQLRNPSSGRCWATIAGSSGVFAMGCGTTNDRKFYFTADDSMK